MISIGVVAPSAVIPQVEFKLGIAKLREEGFKVVVHSQCRKKHLFFAGKDQERAQAFFEYAARDDLQIIWAARGGYGALRILPFLEALTQKHGKPSPKLFIGYSDSVALLEFVKRRWGWDALHAPMPGMREFSVLAPLEWRTLMDLVHRKTELPWNDPWPGQILKFFGKPPARLIESELTGGNLAVIASMIGTPYELRAKGKILFLEDIGEGMYRIDRMLQQLKLSGAFEGVQAIILGNFLQCEDAVGQMLRLPPSEGLSQEEKLEQLSRPDAANLRPLRKKMTPTEGLGKIFGELALVLGIPIGYGLPVGHGPGRAPLPLGAKYRLTPKGRLELVSWKWLRKR